MNRHFSKIIGIAVGHRSLLLAEVAARSGSRPAILALAELPFPEGVSLNTPTELGNALAAFLKTQKFSTKDVFIGLPARRLLTRRKEVPPAAPAVASATLRLQAEAEFPTGDADHFAVDYAGHTSASSPSVVLLVATAQSCLDQCEALARVAGLKLRGITATAAALGRATASLSGHESKGEGMILSLASGGAELVVQQGANATQLRNLAVTNAGTPESIGALAGEIRRTMAALHQNGSPLTLALWDDAAGDSGAAGSLLGERLSLPVTSPSLSALATTDDARANINAFAPAVATAMAALDAAGPPLDFLHSRLAPPRQKSSKRPYIIAGAIAAVVLLAILAGVADLHFKQVALDTIVARHNAHAREIAIAQTASDRLHEARKWTLRKPRYTDCLRDLTNLFDDQTSVWVTSLTLDQDNNGLISGKAVSEPQVRALLEKMLASKQFLSPKQQNISTSATPVRGNGASSEYSFKITFVYKRAGKP